MKIVKPSIQVLDELHEETILKKLEQIGRTCYKSEDKITNDSAAKFVKRIIENGHHAIVEHISISVKVVCDRGVSHEIVRHRIASYAQECVVGDTKLRKNLTIKQLYDRQENGKCYDRTHNKTISLRSVDNNGNVVRNKFVKVFYKGIQPIYEIETELGYKIECTKNHKFLKANGKYEVLNNLSVGSNIMVNGRPSLCYLKDEELKKAYGDIGLSPLGISKEYSIPYRSVITKLKKLRIFVKGKNDKNKEKYNKNHTNISYQKMRNTIINQYQNGRKVWNKGMTGQSSHCFGVNRGDKWRKKMSIIQRGGNNSNWKGGIKEHEEAQRLKRYILKCEVCSSNKKLEVHHKDKDKTNNNLNNIIKVCCKCHNLLHHGWHVGTKIVKDAIKTITYVGEKETYDLKMNHPFHNYIANGFVVHNSTRYCNYSNDKFDNQITVIKPCFWTDKTERGHTKRVIWEQAMSFAEDIYLELISLGATPQEARSILPNSLKTEIVMTMNLREWRHFLTLRTAKTAHPQMREVACMILDEFKFKLPVIFSDIRIENE